MVKQFLAHYLLKAVAVVLLGLALFGVCTAENLALSLTTSVML